MNERMFSGQGKKSVEVEGVSFPDYSIDRKSSILVPKPASKAEILRKESNPESDRAFQSEKVMVATKLVERCEAGEVFPFPGLRPDQYEIMKKEWEEEPEYSQDIDALISRFQNEGMKVVSSEHRASGNVFLLPASSNDLMSDSLLPRLVSVDAIVDDSLLELVVMENLHYLQK